MSLDEAIRAVSNFGIAGILFIIWYFDMKKSHGIEQAMSGFYHEPIYEETIKKNTEWADLRASQQARWAIKNTSKDILFKITP